MAFLSLYDNQLASLPAGIFDKLTDLTELYLDPPSSPCPAGSYLQGQNGIIPAHCVISFTTTTAFMPSNLGENPSYPYYLYLLSLRNLIVGGTVIILLTLDPYFPISINVAIFGGCVFFLIAVVIQRRSSTGYVYKSMWNLFLFLKLFLSLSLSLSLSL